MVLIAAVRTPVVAQESPEGRRGRTRQPTFADTPAPPQIRQSRGDFNSSQITSEHTLTGEPTESIVFTLWIVKVGDSAQPPADELSAKLAERVAALPPVVGSVKEVQELIGQLKVAGLARSVREFRLVAHNGQMAAVQTGKNQPRVVASAVSPDGRMNSIQYEPLGTLVEIRPRIDAERNIQVSVKIGQSDLEKSTEVMLAEPADGSPTFADVITTRQFNTATSLKNNSAVLLQSVSSSDSDGEASAETELIILGAEVVPIATVPNRENRLNSGAYGSGDADPGRSGY
jgi:hypothetical protein